MWLYLVEVVVKVGRKGQVLIPKVLRDEYGIVSNGQAVLRESREGIIISRPKTDSVKEFRKIAFSGAQTKVDIAKYKKMFEEEFSKK